MQTKGTATKMQALPVAAAATALAKGPASVELAGGVKRTTTAKPEARQGMGGKHRDKTRCGLCHKKVSMCSGHCLRRCDDSARASEPIQGQDWLPGDALREGEGMLETLLQSMGVRTMSCHKGT